MSEISITRFNRVDVDIFENPGICLVIDDSEVERKNIRKILEKEGLFSKIIEAKDGLEGFRAFLDNEPDVIICDMMMPHYNGIAFLKMLKEESKRREIMPSVIMLTGMDSLDLKVQGFELGVADYIVKPIEPMELIARVRLHYRLKRLQERLYEQALELERQNQLLQQLSITDPLTGLYNRRYILERLEEEFNGSLRYGYPLGLALVDLDFFKRVNDTYGHQAGDALLRQFATILAANLRKRDMAGRYGGEEFIVILPHTGLEGAKKSMERLRASVEDSQLTFEGRVLKYTISAGVTAFPDMMVRDVWDLIRAADQALYEAKHRGRNRVVAYPG